MKGKQFNFYFLSKQSRVINSHSMLVLFLFGCQQKQSIFEGKQVCTLIIGINYTKNDTKNSRLQKICLHDQI